MAAAVTQELTVELVRLLREFFFDDRVRFKCFLEYRLEGLVSRYGLLPAVAFFFFRFSRSRAETSKCPGESSGSVDWLSFWS